MTYVEQNEEYGLRVGDRIICRDDEDMYRMFMELNPWYKVRCSKDRCELIIEEVRY